MDPDDLADALLTLGSTPPSAVTPSEKALRLAWALQAHGSSTGFLTDPSPFDANAGSDRLVSMPDPIGIVPMSASDGTEDLNADPYAVAGIVPPSALTQQLPDTNLTDWEGAGQGSTATSPVPGDPDSTLPAGAFRYPLVRSNGLGTYQWDADQIRVNADGSKSPTGNAGGRDSITTTNPLGIASTDFSNPQTGLIDRTYYDETGKNLGTFPVVPGTSVQLKDGLTTAAYGMPQAPAADQGEDDGDLSDLRRLQAKLAQASRDADPFDVAYQALDRWASHIELPRSVDFLTPPDAVNQIAPQVDLLNAKVPEARGTRPATANDFINAVGSGFAALTPFVEGAGALKALGSVPESIEVLAGRAPGLELPGGFRAPGLPPSQAELRGVPRFNPDIPEHAAGAGAEEQLANIAQSQPNEQVVRWGDVIGSHGADVISVNTQTGDVTLWDAKLRSAEVRIQESSTFRARSDAREHAIQQAIETIETDTTLPSSIRQRALENVERKQINTRTVAFGNAKNSIIGN